MVVLALVAVVSSYGWSGKNPLKRRGAIISRIGDPTSAAKAAKRNKMPRRDLTFCN